jgi:hypothetical protein
MPLKDRHSPDILIAFKNGLLRRFLSANLNSILISELNIYVFAFFRPPLSLRPGGHFPTLTGYQGNPMKIEHQDIEAGISDPCHFDGPILAQSNSMAISVAVQDYSTG